MIDEAEWRPPSGDCAAVRARDVSVVAHGRHLLRDVTVDITEGAVTAIIGPNGAGKSTLISVLAGDIRAESGFVHYHERATKTRRCAPVATTINDRRNTTHNAADYSEEYRDVAAFRVKDLARHRSVLLQRSAVAFSYTVREVVAMGRAAWATTSPDHDERIVNHAMARTDTQRLADREITTLSGGESARVAVARVLAQNTPIVLLDEPTAALDIPHQERVLELASCLASSGGTVAIVMHDLDAAAAHADRVIVLSAGRVVASGPTEDVMTSEILTRVYNHPIDVLAHPSTARPIIVPARRHHRSFPVRLR